MLYCQANLLSYIAHAQFVQPCVMQMMQNVRNDAKSEFWLE